MTTQQQVSADIYRCEGCRESKANPNFCTICGNPLAGVLISKAPIMDELREVYEKSDATKLEESITKVEGFFEEEKKKKIMEIPEITDQYEILKTPEKIDDIEKKAKKGIDAACLGMNLWDFLRSIILRKDSQTFVMALYDILITLKPLYQRYEAIYTELEEKIKNSSEPNTEDQLLKDEYYARMSMIKRMVSTEIKLRSSGQRFWSMRISKSLLIDYLNFYNNCKDGKLSGKKPVGEQEHFNPRSISAKKLLSQFFDNDYGSDEFAFRFLRVIGAFHLTTHDENQDLKKKWDYEKKNWNEEKDYWNKGKDDKDKIKDWRDINPKLIYTKTYDENWAVVELIIVSNEEQRKIIMNIADLSKMDDYSVDKIQEKINKETVKMQKETKKEAKEALSGNIKELENKKINLIKKYKEVLNALTS